MKAAEQFINLTDDQLAAISAGQCPVCGYRGFLIGPMAGHQINIWCGGVGHGFNVAFFGGVAQMGHRLPDKRLVS